MKENNYECQHCKARGFHKAARSVHHVQWVRRHPRLALSRTYTAEGIAAYDGEPEIVEKEVEKKTWTEDELKNMTVQQIEGLAAYMKYTIEGSNKTEKIASFIAAQTGAGN